MLFRYNTKKNPKKDSITVLGNDIHLRHMIYLGCVSFFFFWADLCETIACSLLGGGITSQNSSYQITRLCPSLCWFAISFPCFQFRPIAILGAFNLLLHSTPSGPLTEVHNWLCRNILSDRVLPPCDGFLDPFKSWFPHCLLQWWVGPTPTPPSSLVPPGESSCDPVLETIQGPIHPRGNHPCLCPKQQQRLQHRF